MLEGPDLAVLHDALAKVQRNRTSAEREQYTRAEIDALQHWVALQLAAHVKETRAERSERRKAAWRSGDRREWGGERRIRDKRRGWRNFSR